MKKPKIQPIVFWGSLAAIALLIAPLALGPEQSVNVMNEVRNWITSSFGWLYLWFTVAIFAVLIWLAAGRAGKIKFGGADAEPEFSTVSWIAMLFTAGIGSSLLYWGAIEWSYYLTDPPFGLEANSDEAARWASTYGLFHWGFTAWAIYCLPGVIIAYAFHQRGHRVLNLSQACRGIIGKHADGWLGKIIDIFFVFGLVGGVGTSLGLGTPMVAEGVSNLTGIPQGLGLNTGIILLWTLLFGLSSFLGLKRGIRRLADLNLYLAAAVGVFILVVGPTLFILDTFTNSVGLLLQNFIPMSFFFDSIGGSDFTEAWTIFYWAWWIAYAPYIGLFTARISRGRTIRQLILAMLLAGSVGCWLAFAILGNTGLYFELNNVVPVTDILANNGAPAAIISILAALPFGDLLLVVFLLLFLIFMATTLDSSAYTLASVATKELDSEQEPARWQRMFWSFVLAVVAIVMIAGGGLEPLQNLTIITSVPLLLVLTLMTLSLRRWLQEDWQKEIDQKQRPQIKAG
ncbi:BCCT family transporter [Desmospora activa]|nr:BCCT family transporter [Desmospora activa]